MNKSNAPDWPLFCEFLLSELRAARRMNEGLMARVAAASEVLTRVAERGDLSPDAVRVIVQECHAAASRRPS